MKKALLIIIIIITVLFSKMVLSQGAFGDYQRAEKFLQKDFPIIGEVRGQGLFLGFELSDVNKNPLSNKATYLTNRMKDLGVLMSIDGQDNNVLKIKPPIVFAKKNADELIFRLKTVFAEDFMEQ